MSSKIPGRIIRLKKTDVTSFSCLSLKRFENRTSNEGSHKLSNKISIPTLRKVTGNSEEREVLKANFFKESLKLNFKVDFPEMWAGGGGEGGSDQEAIHGEGCMDIFWNTHS